MTEVTRRAVFINKAKMKERDGAPDLLAPLCKPLARR